MMMTLMDDGLLAVGSAAPGFDLEASVGGAGQGRFSLASFTGKNLIIVFYPKDQTPGCTKQLCALRDDVGLFEGLNTAIVGSNPGSLASHQRFSEKQAYPFPILVDTDGQMAKAYGALTEEGRIQRTVYILDGQGVVRYAKRGMPSDAELAEAIRQFGV